MLNYPETGMPYNSKKGSSNLVRLRIYREAEAKDGCAEDTGNRPLW